MECMSGAMAISMRENGSNLSDMVMDQTSSLTVTVMSANMKLVSHTALANINGRMVRLIYISLNIKSAATFLNMKPTNLYVEGS